MSAAMPTYTNFLAALSLDPRYVPHHPHPKQAAFLLANGTLEVLYGGQAAGGKSEAMLMAALQYVHVPAYSAILMRRTYRDLALPGSIMDRAHTWLRHRPDVHWDGTEHVYTWKETGARLSFGYMESDTDKFRYGSAEYQFVGIDEVSQFREGMYTFMASRLRRLAQSTVPLRLRSGTNPVGIGAQWLYNRFIRDGNTTDRLFISAGLEDNPSIDAAEYDRALRLLDPVMYRRLRHGDWRVQESGGMFAAGCFDAQKCSMADVPIDGDVVRYWDLASTAPSHTNTDPDYTVGLLMRHCEGRYFILDVRRDRVGPHGVEQLLRLTAQEDGRAISIHIEQEGGSSGSIAIDHYQRHALNGYEVYGHRQTGDKVTRARPFSAAVAAKHVFLVDAPWNDAYIDELVAFPQRGVHDDQVDVSSGAHYELAHVVHGG